MSIKFSTVYFSYVYFYEKSNTCIDFFSFLSLNNIILSRDVFTINIDS